MDALLLLAKKHTLTISLVGAGVALLATLLIYIISIFTNKSLNLNIGPLKLSTGNGKKKLTEEENYYIDAIKRIEGLLTFYNRENYKSQTLVDSIVDESIEKTEEKDKIKFKETVTRQMIQAEEMNVEIKVLLTEKYADLLRKKLDDNSDVKQHRDYRFYQVIISSILDELKRSTLKQSIQNTDIIILSDLEFDTFVDQKASVMITIIIEYLDFMYNTTSVISRDDVHTENEKIKPEIKSILKELFKRIKQIIIEDKELIQRINEKMNSNIDKIHDIYIQDNPITKIQEILNKKEA